MNNRLPIKLDSTSNGEFMPVPLAPANRAANSLAHEAATQNAQRLGVRRGEHTTRLQQGTRRERRLLRPFL